MIIVKRNSPAWKASRMYFLDIMNDCTPTMLPYDAYKHWIKQQGGRETAVGIKFKHETDAVPFLLKYDGPRK